MGVPTAHSPTERWNRRGGTYRTQPHREQGPLNNRDERPSEAPNHSHQIQSFSEVFRPAEPDDQFLEEMTDYTTTWLNLGYGALERQYTRTLDLQTTNPNPRTAIHQNPGPPGY